MESQSVQRYPSNPKYTYLAAVLCPRGTLASLQASRYKVLITKNSIYHRTFQKTKEKQVHRGSTNGISTDHYTTFHPLA